MLYCHCHISGNQHPGRSDSGWRSRDESKKDSLLPEWAQQDGTHNTENKSTQKVCSYTVWRETLAPLKFGE